MMSRSTLVVLSIIASLAVVSAVGPACDIAGNNNPFCCHGNWEAGKCVCWSVQYFGEACNYQCRKDLCNTHGICTESSNPQYDETTGEVTGGVCHCDASRYYGARCLEDPPNNCADFFQNGQETDVDCGGPVCGACANNKKCLLARDCKSGNCVDNNGVKTCKAAACNDSIKNGLETDVDCGGGTCPKCATGKVCKIGSDCLSGKCVNGICTANPDAPEFTDSTPTLTPVTDTSITVQLQLNKASIVYIVLVPQGSTAPSVAEVLAGTGAGGAAALIAASRDVPAAYSTVTITLAIFLTPNTAYDLYFVARDKAVPPHTQLAVTKRSVVTAASDVFPPNFWLDFPKMTDIQDVRATVNVALNEPGVFYYAILPAGSAAPSIVNVLAGTAPGAVASGTGDVTSPFLTFTAVANGLTKQTQYVCWVAAKDDASPANTQSVMRSVTFTTTGDSTPPQFVNGYPVITDITSQGFTLGVQLNEVGFFMYVVLPAGWAHVPSALQVIQGVDGTGSASPVAASGSKAVASASVTVQTWITSLQDDTTYDVYVVGVDTAVNVMASPVLRVVKTLPDTESPLWMASYPQLNTITSHSVTVNNQLNEPGIVYFVIIPASATVPSVAQVMAGYSGTATYAGSIAVPLASTTYVALGLGLSASTNYIACLVAADDSSPPHIQNIVVQLPFTTPVDTYPPAWMTGYPKITTITNAGATLEVQVDDPGTVYYVVVLHGAAQPTVSQILAGQNSAGATALAGNSIACALAATTYTGAFSGLQSSVRYDVHIVVRDSIGNVSPIVMKDFTTSGNDTSPPSWVVPYPNVNVVSGGSASLHVQLNEVGIVYYFITFWNLPAPTANQVITGSGGSTPLVHGAMLVSSASTTFSVIVNGLTPSTRYTVYFLAGDAASPINYQTVATGIAFNTTANSHCANSVQDGTETDVDCGGSTCSARCPVDDKCNIDSDCQSSSCVNGRCAASCTGCAADQVTLQACTSSAVAVCGVRPPSVTTVTHTGGSAAVTLTRNTVGSYMVATRNGEVPSCSVQTGNTQFDTAGVVQVIRTADSTSSTSFTIFGSGIIRVIGCADSLAPSGEAIHIIIVNGQEIRVPAFYVLDPLIIGDFTAVKRVNYTLSVHEVLGVAQSRVSIDRVVANTATPGSRTDCSYSIGIPTSGVDPADIVALYNALLIDINNVHSNGTFREALVRNKVLPSGSGGNQGGGQETVDGPGVDTGSSDWSWLWWFIPIIILLFVCCICCILWWQREQEKKRYRRVSAEGSLAGAMGVVPGEQGQSFRSDCDDGEALGDELVDGPNIAHAAYTGAGNGAGGAGGDYDAEIGESTVDLTRVVNEGGDISSAIEAKGDATMTWTEETTTRVQIDDSYLGDHQVVNDADLDDDDEDEDDGDDPIAAAADAGELHVDDVSHFEMRRIATREIIRTRVTPDLQ